jgi:UDP-N-acetylglucosamine 2-epimerase (non-hydrolysing)
MPLKVLAIAGTRPEAIKIAPVVQAMRARTGDFRPQICLTGQHRELVEHTLPIFGLTADVNLDVMTPGQSLGSLTAKVLAGLEPVLARLRPDLVLVQGDTTTTFCGALAAFYAGIPVAHVEAGLRTGDAASPFPEEINRRLVTRLATFHFAVTADAATHLRQEGIPDSRLWITGNTGIDAILKTTRLLTEGAIASELPIVLDACRKLVLVTAHRRENIHSGLREIALGVRRLAERTDVQIVLPVHPNPQVRAVLENALADHERIHLINPLPYVAFVEMMRRAYLILSDSGGIQEEAPALGKPVLVLRDTTERTEAISSGASRLVGPRADSIVKHANELLNCRTTYAAMARPRAVYGDGHASERICEAILSCFSSTREPAFDAGNYRAMLEQACASISA